MIRGIGIDLIETERIAKIIADDKGFKERVFSEREIVYCDALHYQAQHFAARFCAKEAFFKALGSGLRHGMSWREVEVINDKLGAPSLILSGRAAEVCAERRLGPVHVSLTHNKTQAAAVVILEETV